MKRLLCTFVLLQSLVAGKCYRAKYVNCELLLVVTLLRLLANVLLWMHWKGANILRAELVLLIPHIW